MKLFRKTNLRVEETQFTTNFTPETAYILGLLWADGHISTINTKHALIVNMITEDAIELVPIFLKTGAWRVYNYQRKNWKPQTTITTNNRPIAKFLVANNYQEKNKTAEPILACIPEELQPYWFRGLFDGDGCIYRNNKSAFQVSITGPLDQDWSFLTRKLEELNIKFSLKRATTKKGGGYSAIRMTNKPSCLKFRNYIYSDTQKFIGLKRKYLKFFD